MLLPMPSLMSPLPFLGSWPIFLCDQSYTTPLASTKQLAKNPAVSRIGFDKVRKGVDPLRSTPFHFALKAKV